MALRFDVKAQGCEILKSQQNIASREQERLGSVVTCLPVFGPVFVGIFQFSGMPYRGRWTRKDDEEIEVFRGADRFHSASG